MMTVKKTFQVLTAVFLPVGLLLLLTGVGFWLEDAAAKGDMARTTAEIIEISDGNITVTYQSRGAAFESRLHYFNPSRRVGDTVTIYVDPQHPELFRDVASSLPGIILLSLGFMLFIPGGIFGALLLRRRRLRDRLLFDGMRVEAQIVSATWVSYIHINNRNPYLIAARWHDKDTGEYYDFKSPYLTYDPAPLLNERGITTVPVYLDRGNYRKYHMALEEYGLE